MDEDAHIPQSYVSIGERYGERSRLPFVLGGVLAVVYGVLACAFAYGWFARDNFDVIFIVAVISLPSSYIGNGIGHELQAFLSPEHVSSVEVVLMICLGLLQYFGLGYFAGWLLARFIKSAVEHP